MSSNCYLFVRTDYHKWRWTEEYFVLNQEMWDMVANYMERTLKMTDAQ
jgi:hypothetical protein